MNLEYSANKEYYKELWASYQSHDYLLYSNNINLIAVKEAEDSLQYIQNVTQLLLENNPGSHIHSIFSENTIQQKNMQDLKEDLIYSEKMTEDFFNKTSEYLDKITEYAINLSVLEITLNKFREYIVSHPNSIQDLSLLHLDTALVQVTDEKDLSMQTLPALQRIQEVSAKSHKELKNNELKMNDDGENRFKL